MKKKIKIIPVLLIILASCGISYAIYDVLREKDMYEIKLWDNIYNGNSLTFFYEEESDLRIEMLNATYNLEKKVNKDDELGSILSLVSEANSIVEIGDVNDTKALNGYDVIRLIGEKRQASKKDMALIIRDFIISVGYDARIGEFRCNKKDQEQLERYYVIEYYSKEYSKWIAIDFVDEGYFIFDGKPCSGIELAQEDISKIEYIGNIESDEYFSSNKKIFKTYTIMIDNTASRKKSNTVLTYIDNENQITLTYRDETLMPIIYTENIELFNIVPGEEGAANDTSAYIVMMKSEEQEVERFVVGGFKDGSIMNEYYVGRNDGSFESVNEYFEVELIKGENMISISQDGIKEDARIEIIYN